MFLMALLPLLSIQTCTIPAVIEKRQRPYEVIHWNGGPFFYVTYYWQGQSIDEVQALRRRFVGWAQEQNYLALPVSRYPQSSIWQIGFVSLVETVERDSFDGYAIERMDIPAGGYAEMTLTGDPEGLRFRRQEFELMLQDDGLVVESPPYEIFPELVADTLKDDPGIYHLRFLIGAAEQMLEENTEGPPGE